jgi:hypothetical protein
MAREHKVISPEAAAIFELQRQTKELQLKNTEKALQIVYENIEKALDVIIKGLSSRDLWYRYNCATFLIKKVLPDKKIREISGPDGGPIKVEEKIDKREQILDMIVVLDSISIDELRRRSENGSKGIFEAEFKTEERSSEEMEREEETDSRGERSGRGPSPRTSTESLVSASEGSSGSRFDGEPEESSRRNRRTEEY